MIGMNETNPAAIEQATSNFNSVNCNAANGQPTIPDTVMGLQVRHAGYIDALREIKKAIQELEQANHGRETTGMASLRWAYVYVRKEERLLAVAGSSFLEAYKE